MNRLPSRELREVVACLNRLEPGEEAVLATVVATQGSTYRKAGARMLMTRSAWLAGSVSGGCLESDLVSSAWRRTEEHPALVTYDSTSDDDIVWGFGLGCNGVVQLLLERVHRESEIVAALRAVLSDRVPIHIATVCQPGPDLAHRVITPISSHAGSIHSAPEGWFEETIYPPKKIAVFGAGFDAVPLVAIGRELGWSMTVLDHRQIDQGLFGGADEIVSKPFAKLQFSDFAPCDGAVIMSHHYLNDQQALRMVHESVYGYIGLLGPRVRTNRLLNEVGIAHSDPRIHSPIGLSIGAQGPHEIALAIAAEIQVFFSEASTITRQPIVAGTPVEIPLCGLSQP